MSNTEKIKIVKIGRKQQPSKFKPGETYSITTIMDEKNRKLVAMGAWGDKWQIGDEIEATIEEKKWTDKDGFEQVSLNLKNPNQTAFSPRGGGSSFVNPIVVAYQLAATLAPLFYSDKKKITLADVDKLAEELKKRIESTPAASATKEKEVPTIDVVKEKTTEDSEAKSEEEEDRPF